MRFGFRWWMSIFSVLCLGASAGVAGDGPAVDRVEEDWKVVIDDPDPDSTGPQITTCMSPSTGATNPFIAFCLNYRDDPAWKPGGLQVKAYAEAIGASRDRPLLAAAAARAEVFQTAGETITWTQRVSVSGGVVRYSVRNGSSTTWGAFGQGADDLGVDYPSSIADLGSYRPDDSVSLSAAGWQADRVQSMTLLRVRYYKGVELVATDATPREVVRPGTTTSTE